MNVGVKGRLKNTEVQSRITSLQILREDAVEDLVTFSCNDVEGDNKTILEKYAQALPPLW